MAKEKKAFEIAQRVEIIKELLLRGYTLSKISKIVNSKDGDLNWEIEYRTLTRYVGEARKSLKEDAKGTKKQYIDLALNRYADLYNKNYKEMDYKECRAIQGDINKLLGLNEPEKLDVKSKQTVKVKPDLSKLSAEELRALKDLKEKLS